MSKKWLKISLLFFLLLSAGAACFSSARLIAPDRQARAREHWQDLLRTGCTSAVLPFMRQDQVRRWGHIEAVRINRERMLAFTTDVTETVLLSERLKQSEAQLARAQAMSRIGSWEIDLADNAVHASDEAKRIYGLSGKELSIDQIESVPLPAYRTMLDTTMASLVADGAPYDVTFKIKQVGTGEIRRVHSVAEYDAERNVVVGTLHDITVERPSEDAVRDAVGPAACDGSMSPGDT